MNEPKHTPGPWKWHWRQEDGIANGSVFHEPRAGHAWAIAMTPRYAKKEQWESDARLIAAAPDMLAALKIAREWMPQKAITEEALEETRIVEAAIAKAEGRP